MKKKLKLILADDHQIMTDGLQALLSDVNDIEVVGIATNGKDVLELLGTMTPDVVVTDINMPLMDGVTLTREIITNHQGVRVLALSMSNESEHIADILEAGASGYILKNTGKEELVKAIRKVSAGELYFSDEVSAQMMRAMSARTKKKEVAHEVRLTEREYEIIKLITQELSNAQIADKLFISERTVETHRKNIFRKTNTKSVVGLIKMAMENGWNL